MIQWIFIITIWAGSAPGPDGENDISTSITQNFFYVEQECLDAARRQGANYVKRGLRNFTIECHKRSGPLMSPETAEEAKAK